MDWQWILDQLEKIPGFGPIVTKLQVAFDIWRYDANDPQPLRAHAQAQRDFHARAKQLADALNINLYALQQSWHGDMADLYLGQTTAFAVEHDTETSAVGYQMWQNIASLSDVLLVNATGHDMGADRLQAMGDKKVTLNVEMGVAMGIAGAVIIAPEAAPVEELGLDGDAAVAGGTAAGLLAVGEGAVPVETVIATTSGLQAGLIVGGIAVVATAIAGVALYVFVLHQPHSAANNPPSSPLPPGITPGSIQAQRYLALIAMYGDAFKAAIEALVKLDLTEPQITALLQSPTNPSGFSNDEIVAMTKAGFTKD